MKERTFNKLLSLLVSFAMIFTMLPVNVFADDSAVIEDTEQTKDPEAEVEETEPEETDAEETDAEETDAEETDAEETDVEETEAEACKHNYVVSEEIKPTCEDTGNELVKNEDGSITAPAPSYVAQIGTQDFDTLADAFAAATVDDEVKILTAGTYSLTGLSGKNITVTGAVDGVVFINIGKHNMGSANVTFDNVTFTYAENSTYNGLQHSGDLVYNDCTINGQVFLYGESETFNNCVFNTTDSNNYNVWTYGAEAVEFNGCTFNSAGKSVLVYSEQTDLVNDITVTDCDFIATSAVDGKAAIEIDTSLTAGANISIDSETTATGFGLGNVSGNSLWNNKKGNEGANNDITIVVSDETVLKPETYVAQVGETKYADLQEAIVAAAPAGTVEILADVTVDEWIMIAESLSIGNGDIITCVIDGMTINGNGYTLTVNSIESASNGGRLFFDATELSVKDLTIKYADGLDGAIGLKAGTIENVTFDGCTYGVMPQTGDVVITGCTFKTTGTSIYFEEERDSLTVTGCTFENVDTANVILLRGDVQFTNNNIVSGRTVNVVSGSPVVTGNDFNDVRLKVYNVATATISGNEINVLAFNDDSEVKSTFTSNTLSEEAQAVLDAATAPAFELEGSGTESDPFLINNIDDLVWFRNDVNAGNTYEGKYVKLTSNIDLDGYSEMNVNYESNNVSAPTFRPIGDTDSGASFKGTFDGGEYTISNLYISGWDINYHWDNYGSAGLFGTVDNATIKNLTVSGFEIQVEGGDVAAIAGHAIGDCTFENITVTNSKIATYNNGCAGIVAWSEDGFYTFKDIEITDSVVLAGLWGSFDSSIGGVLAQADANATYHFEDVDIACRLDIYNDVTAAYKYYLYRMCGMLIGRSTRFISGTNEVNADNITCKNVNITIGEWANYTYIWDDTLSYGCKRVEPGYTYGGIDVTQYPNAEITMQPMTSIIGGDQYGYSGSTAEELANQGFDEDQLKVEDLALEIRSRVAMVGTTYYTSLQTAINEANGEKITLIADVTENITIAEGANVTIDLGGKTLTGYIAPCKPASLTVSNGSIKNTNADYSAIEINAGELELTEVKIESARHAVRIDGAVTATIDGGTYKTVPAEDSKITQHAVNISGAANVTIKNGTFAGPKGTTADSGSAICTKAAVIIENGTFSGGKNNTLVAKDGGTIAITGGTFDQDPSAYVADGYKAVESEDNWIVKEHVVLSGSGTATDPYIISNLNELKAFRDYVNEGNTYADEYIKLTADIDLTGEVWIPIGTSNYDKTPEDETVKMFAGNFDGGNHTITGLTSDGYVPDVAEASKEYSFGLFGYVYGANISNVKLANVDIDCGTRQDSEGNNRDGSGVAALIGYYFPADEKATVIENCHVLSGTIKASNNMGGLIGHLDSQISQPKVDITISNCSNAADVTTEAREAGGILGLMNSAREGNYLVTMSGTVTFKNCVNTGAITSLGGGSPSAGGILGRDHNQAAGQRLKIIFDGCKNSGTITVTANGETHAAGIGSGYYSAGAWLIAKDCENTGNVVVNNSGTYKVYAGGLISYGGVVELINSTSTGTVTGGIGNKYVGGAQSILFLEGMTNFNDTVNGYTYYLNGGTSPEYAALVDDASGGGNFHLVETAYKDGAEFAGWYDNADLTGEAYTALNSSVKTYYAKWNITAVAQIGNTTYPSLQAAIDEAQAGETVTLLRNINLGDVTSAIIIPKNITIDGEGYWTITINSVNDTWNNAAFAPSGPIAYTFKNLTIKLNNEAPNMAAFSMKYGGTLENVTVKGAFGKAVDVSMAYALTVTDCTFDGAAVGVNAPHSYAPYSTVTITGTTFNTTGAAAVLNENAVFTDNIIAAGSYVQASGYQDVSKNFWNGNNATGEAPTADQLKGDDIICDTYYAANNKGVLSDLRQNGVAETPVIKVEITGGETYEYGPSKLALLSELLGSNTAAGAKITLLDNVTLDNGIQVAAFGKFEGDEYVITPKTVEIDLNGKTLTGFIQINSGVTATIKNGTVNNSSNYPAIDVGGIATVEDMTVKSSVTKAFRVTEDGALTVKTGTYSSDPTAYLANGFEAVETNGTWTVSQIMVVELAGVQYATIKDALWTLSSADTTVHTLKVLVDHEIDVNYSTFNYPILVNGFSVVLDLNGKTITADWSKFTGSRADNALIGMANGGKLTIIDSVGGGTIRNMSDGKDNVENRIFWLSNAHSTKETILTIEGGTFIQEEDIHLLYVEGLTANSDKKGYYTYIKGGHFEMVGYDDFFNSYDGRKHETEISGGTFNINPTDWELKIADGFKVEKDETTGLYGIVVDNTERGTWGGIDWTLTEDGTLTIAPTKGTPVADKNYPGRTYEVGEWREAVRYDSKGEGVAIEGWPYDRTKVKKLVIEEGVTSIGSFTAQGFTNLTGEVVIPSTVTYIGQEAFQTSTFTKLTFAADGTEELCIAQGAFKNLIIEEVALPADRPVHLHAWVFNNCHNLKHATLPATLVSVHGTNHIDYFKDFDAHSNPTWTKSSEIFAYNENMETITFGSEAVRDMFFANNNGTSKDYTVATAGLTAYNAFEKAWDAAQDGDTVKLLKNASLDKMLVNNKNITLDLNGNTITGTDNTEKNFSIIDNRGNLTITGNGKITLTATVNSGWNRYSAVIANNPGGKLIVESGTIEHLGGTDMAYGIDNLTNGKGTYAETVINGGTIKSPYRAIRQFLNGVEAQNILTVNGGTIEGANKSIWMQDPSKNANSGTLTVSENATLNGDVYLFVTEGSTEWPVSVSIANAAFQDESTVLTGNVPEGYVVENSNGTWGVREANYVAQVGDVKYETIQAAVAAADGETVTLLADVTTEMVVIAAGTTVTIDMAGYDITCTTTDTYALDVYGKLILTGTADSVVTGGICINDANSEVVMDKVTVQTLDTTLNGMYNVLNYGGKFTMNSGKLYVENDLDSVLIALWAYGGTTVINGGEIVSKDTYNKAGDDAVYAILATNSAVVTVDGATVNGAGGAIAANSGAVVTVKSGSFTSGLFHSAYGGSGSVAIEGGTFKGTLHGNVEASGGTFDKDPTNFVADGYQAVDNGDGTWTVEEVSLFDIERTNIRMGSDLSLLFAFKQGILSDTDGVYATITKSVYGGNSTSIDIAFADWSTMTIGVDKYHVIEFAGIAAKEMTDDVTIIIKDAEGNALSNAYTTNLREYAMEKLSSSSNSKFKVALVDMLNYGSAAQQYFIYNTSDLANANLSEEQKSLASAEGTYEDNKVVDATYYNATNLRFVSKINLLFRLNIPFDTYAVFTWTDHYGDEHSKRIENTEYALSSGMYVVELDELVVSDARVMVTCTIYNNSDNSVVTTVIDSVEGEVASTADTSAVKPLYVAFMKFADSAYAYLHN